MSSLEYNYAVRRIHLMRVYGTHVIRLIHHYASECIISQLRASILAAIYHGQVEITRVFEQMTKKFCAKNKYILINPHGNILMQKADNQA